MNKSILIVEDDEDIARNLLTLLSGEGYEVSHARNGKLALDHLKQVKPLPSLILLDLMMPVMDGFQFRTHQQEQPEFAAIPVIIMTADGHVDEKKKRANANAFVRKPLDIESFLEVIELNFAK